MHVYILFPLFLNFLGLLCGLWEGKKIIFAVFCICNGLFQAMLEIGNNMWLIFTEYLNYNIAILISVAGDDD